MSVDEKDPTTRDLAHDLNNIFAALSGFTELLLDDLAPETMSHLFATKILKGQVEAEKLMRAILARLDD